MYEKEEQEKLNPKWHSSVNLGTNTTLVIIDMQKLFLTEKKSPWSSSKLLSIIPNIEKLIKTMGKKNVIFTRFVPPKKWQDESGSWRTYYRLNKAVTRENIGNPPLDIIDKLQKHVSKNSVVNRTKSSSVFAGKSFQTKIKRKATKFLIFAGIETDYCVLASVLDAMNRGYYVIVVSDACGSTARGGHKNALDIFERFPEQLWLTSTSNIIKQLKSKKQ